MASVVPPGRRRHRVGELLALLVMGIAAVALVPVSAASAATTPTLSLTGPATSVVNTPVTLTVTGTNLNDGAKITLQKFSGLFWNNVGAAATYSTATGQVTFSVTPTAVGTVRYRATTPNPALFQPAVKSPEFALVTTATAPPPPPDCGETVLKSDGTPWECTFVDDFEGAELDRTKWIPQTNYVNGSPTTYACYIDDPAVVSQSNGTLKLTTRKMPNLVNCPETIRDANGNEIPLDDVPYASGQVSTYNRWYQQHGRFEARMKSPLFEQTKLHEAFWLYPEVPAAKPHTGEIDISETFGTYLTRSVPSLHYDNGTGVRWVRYTGSNSAVATTAHDCVANRNEWNTYTLEWDAARLEVKVNGQTCLVNTSGNETLNKKYMIALTSAIEFTASSYADLDAGPKTTEVDYVRAWK